MWKTGIFSLLGVVSALSAWADIPGLVRVRGAGFEIDGKPYRFVGANFWPPMNLGAPGAPGEDRARLRRELDKLQAMGIDNVRILAASEGPETEPFRAQPALQNAPGQFDEKLLLGLDYALDEMRARGMKAVLVLGNFWQWSGGMAQFNSWFGAGPIPYPTVPGGSWWAYENYVSDFYVNAPAVAAYRETLRKLVTRVNAYSGLPYREDPAIMSWQLANEPRGMGHVEAFNRWIRESAALIHELDPNHLVSAGLEGDTAWPQEKGLDFTLNHQQPGIDYATIHLWVQNFGWYDPWKPETYEGALAKAKAYLDSHLSRAVDLKMPVVLEEFGIGRDGATYDPASTVKLRDSFYREVFEELLKSARAGGRAAGANFWAWSGEARPANPGGDWKSGDPWLGDPPHEPQGWYGVYDSDVSTVELIRDYARKFREL
jgi:mannan endo-1,4-beta-mannosidase